MNTEQFFTHIHLTLSENGNGRRQLQQFVQAIAKTIHRTCPDIEQELVGLSGYQTVTIEKERNEDIIAFLQNTQKTTSESVQPIRLLIEKNGHILIAHSLLGSDLPKKMHQSLQKINGQYCRIVRCETLLAESIAYNALERFAQQNEPLVRYLIATHFSQRNRNKTLLPCDGKFAFDYVKTMKQFGLYQKETLKNKEIDAYKGIFYSEKNEQGFLRHIEHPLFQDLVVPEFLQHVVNVKTEMNRKKAEQTSYSTSFQTKKRINKATQNKMDQNEFLTHYGFVEIDNEVSLARFAHWENAFKQLTTHLSLPTAMDHSLRIRRLGKLKATGMYYPSFKTTVFDVEAPHAFAHEFGHQLDYTQAKNGRTLSSEVTFRPILDTYKVLTQRAGEDLPHDDAFRVQWEGKGKYNKSYYWTPTEIFARSFELYLHKKGIQSPLLNETLTGIVYPKDEGYLEKITHYFDALWFPK